MKAKFKRAHDGNPIDHAVRSLRRAIRRAESLEDVNSAVESAMAEGKDVYNALFLKLSDHEKSLSVIYATHVATETNMKGADRANAYERIAAFMLQTAIEKELRPSNAPKDPHGEITLLT